MKKRSAEYEGGEIILSAVLILPVIDGLEPHHT